MNDLPTQSASHPHYRFLFGDMSPLYGIVAAAGALTVYLEVLSPGLAFLSAVLSVNFAISRNPMCIILNTVFSALSHLPDIVLTLGKVSWATTLGNFTPSLGMERNPRRLVASAWKLAS